MEVSFSEILTYLDKIVNFALFTVNTKEITLAELFKLIVIITIFIFLSRLLKKRFLQRILERVNLEAGIRYTLIRITQYLIIGIGFIVGFQFIGIDLSGLAVIFGFLSVGIGFGLQNIASNFIAGLILLFERPIKVGDRVTIGDTEGDVQHINIRSTTINSLGNISIIVPNSDFISSKVTNWSYGDPKIKVMSDVGVSYNSNLQNVIDSLKEVARDNPEVLKSPEPEVLLVNFGDSSWDMQLRYWIANPKRYHYVKSDINCAIVHKFRENDIEIPFPQRDLHVRSGLHKD